MSMIATGPPSIGTTETDAYGGEVPARLPTPLLRELSIVSPLRSTVAIAAEWAGIVGAILLYQQVLHPATLPLVVVWIGARQHALAVLMHDGAHYLLYRNRTLNAVVSELLLAWPLFITTRAYRGTHFAHHRYVNTGRDPDFMRKQNGEWEFPKNWRGLATLLLKDVLGLNTRQQILEAVDLSEQQDPQARRFDAYRTARLGFYVALLAAVTYLGAWPQFLLLWMLPMLTWLKMIMRVRSIAEHFAIENDHTFTRSRTTLPSFLERLFVAPRNVHFHLEHHLYPSVPFFRLPRLHGLLMADPIFESRAHVTSTYWGVLQECVGGGQPPR